MHDCVCAFEPPKRYITLFREDGGDKSDAGLTINLPLDPKLATRLVGAPSASRLWPWMKKYAPETQQGLLRLVSAIKKELQKG